MSDSVTITTLIIAAIPATIASIVSAIIVFRLANVTKATHALVNGSMLLQLKLHANTAKELYTRTQDPEALKISEAADLALKNYEERSAIVQ